MKRAKKMFLRSLVRMKGLEPIHRKALDPKSSASTNSATSALERGAKVKNELIPESYYLHCPAQFNYSQLIKYQHYRVGRVELEPLFSKRWAVRAFMMIILKKFAQQKDI